MEREIKKIKNYLKAHYGAEPLCNTEGEKFVDEGESIICCFHFPDADKRRLIIGNGNNFPELMLLIVRDDKGVFIRICQGEAKGLSWEEVQKICVLLDGNK